MKAETKRAALAARPGSTLVYLKPLWAAVWQQDRLWTGQTIVRVDYDDPTQIWWGPVDQAKTRKVLIQGLKENQ